MDKIWLLDSNPMKVKCHNDWLKDIKEKRNFFKIEEDLNAGYIETLKNLELYLREDTFTVGEVIPEFEEFRIIVSNVYERLTNKKNGKIRGKAKKNQEKFYEIIQKVNTLNEQIKSSLYNPRLDEGFVSMNNLVTAANHINIQLNKYSNTDIVLVTTALTRANNGQETDILTPDSDIGKIKNASLELIGKQNNEFESPEYLEDKIRIFNTYNNNLSLQRRKFLYN